MPKAAPTQVIIHRIELQDTERRMLETAVASYSFRSVSKGVFNLTSDVTTVVILILAYEWITGREVIDDALALALGTGEGVLSALVNNWRTYRSSPEYSEEYYERAHSVSGGLRNMIDQIIDLLTGGVAERLNQQFNEGTAGGGGGY